jgi:deazaflavin-dependent oxidoreductase (nitroreductase family)
MDVLRKVFWWLNKFFMVPVFRMGLAPIICNPLSGYIMVIKNTGRKTGKLRYTPTNYAIINGQVYCLAGFGKKAHWYLNMVANPNVELILPGRELFGAAEEVLDADEALIACKQVLRNAGFAGFLEGYNPFRAPDEKFLRTLERAPVMRISQSGIGNGPKDQGGWAWLPLWGLIVLIVWVLIR